MAELRCETCGGIEVEDACVCRLASWATAVEEDNARLRDEVQQWTSRRGAVLTTLSEDDLSVLSDDELDALTELITAEQASRRTRRQPLLWVDDIRAGIEAQRQDTYTCPTHGARRKSLAEVRQAERDEVCLYVCTLCGQVAD
jgi:hypothetical protein